MLKSHLYLVFPRAMSIVACLAAGLDINGIKEKLRRAKRLPLVPLTGIALSRAFIQLFVSTFFGYFLKSKLGPFVVGSVHFCSM